MTNNEFLDFLPDNPPLPGDCSEPLLKALDSIVSVRTRIPDDAMTASILGTEREGHGVVINAQGLVLTIGYLVTEAESVWLVDKDGKTLPGHVVGYDQESGFGVVQALGNLALPAVEFGTSADLEIGQPMLLAGVGGVQNAQQVMVAGIDEFAGYWEYLLDDAIFTAPAHPGWGGAALLSEEGELCGIGSLILQTVDEDDATNAANMVIPVDLLPPILNDLMLYGKRDKPARPWVGWFAQESGDGLVIVGLTDDGPADKAGLRSGDRIIELNGESVETLPELFRGVWSAGNAGVELSVLFERDDVPETTTVSTIDRNSRLKTARFH